ncbi:hypothetical protein FQA39_LY03602 [Lamprigera yunnana]|nr:hypothetical protein FQA39_LY03602 [Lamprigera yunnana]
MTRTELSVLEAISCGENYLENVKGSDGQLEVDGKFSSKRLKQKVQPCLYRGVLSVPMTRVDPNSWRCFGCGLWLLAPDGRERPQLLGVEDNFLLC